MIITKDKILQAIPKHAIVPIDDIAQTMNIPHDMNNDDFILLRRILNKLSQDGILKKHPYSQFSIIDKKDLTTIDKTIEKSSSLDEAERNLIAHVKDLIDEAIGHGDSKDVADALGKGKTYVNYLVSNYEKSLSIRVLARLFAACGYRMNVSIDKIGGEMKNLRTEIRRIINEYGTKQKKDMEEYSGALGMKQWSGSADDFDKLKKDIREYSGAAVYSVFFIDSVLYIEVQAGSSIAGKISSILRKKYGFRVNRSDIDFISLGNEHQYSVDLMGKWPI